MFRDHRKLSDLLDFAGTETLGNRILNFLRHFSCFFSVVYVSTRKILRIQLYCTFTN